MRHRNVSTVGRRVASRAIDFVALIPVIALLVGVEALVRAATGVERDQVDGDWVSSMMGFLALFVFVSYDPITSALFGGATPGKRALGQHVVRWQDGTTVRGPLLWGRSALLFLEWILVVPGVVDLVRTSRRADRRTWIDHATGTAVVGGAPTSAPPQQQPPPSYVPRPEPWGGLVGAAAAARARFAHTVGPVPPGPLRERLEEVGTRVSACEAECVRVADRGIRLSQVVTGTDLAGLRNRHQSATADPSQAALAMAYERELASAERLDGLLRSTTQQLQQLVAELNSAVNTAIEIALSPSSDATFQQLLDHLDGLRASLKVVEQAASPPAI